MFAGLGLGLGLVIVALVLLVMVLVVVAIRRLPRSVQNLPQPSSPFISPDSPHSNEAIMVVQSGGRVEYLNDLAREWFGMRNEEPADLERLVRRARPAEDLLNLCARQGQKRLSVGGRLVEVTSYQVPGPYLLMLVTMRSVDLSANLDQTKADSSILQIITDFGKDVSASLDLEETLHSILLNVSHLVPADLLEIKTWNASRQTLAPYTLEVTVHPM
jgi:hypothetical protein